MPGTDISIAACWTPGTFAVTVTSRGWVVGARGDSEPSRVDGAAYTAVEAPIDGAETTTSTTTDEDVELVDVWGA
jgi:hypothetical protein